MSSRIQDAGAGPRRQIGRLDASADDAWRVELATNPPVLELDGTVKYRPGRAVVVPHLGGVYLVHDLRGVLYVGRTADLRVRFGQHFWDSHNSRLTAAIRRSIGELQFSWIVADAAEQDDLERHLIRTFQPLCNRLRYRST